MTSYDFDISLKKTFIGMHVLFIAGAAIYISQGKYEYATFFAISSVLALLYVVMYQTGLLQTRMQAHLNLIEEAVKKSEDFRERVEYESEQGNGETSDLKEILLDKNVKEVKDFTRESLEDESKMEKYEGRKEFLKQVKQAEQAGHDRKTLTEFIEDTMEEE